MKKLYFPIITVILLDAYMSATMLTKDSEIVSDPIWAKTIILEQDEEYRQNENNKYEIQSKFCRCTINDSSYSIIDTLCGVAFYRLYFDTTNLASGKELLRTKDFLYRISRLNRTVEAYTSIEITEAPREIIVADSLIRKQLTSKKILMERYTPYYIPYHPFGVEFTIVPLKKKDNEKGIKKRK